MGRQAEDRFHQVVQAAGLAVLALSRESAEGALWGVRLTEVRVKLDADAGTSVLVVAKGVKDSGKVIAFVGANTLEAGLIALKKKLQAGVLRWREDLPWGEGG